MVERSIGRRQVLRGAGAAAGGLAVTGVAAAAATPAAAVRGGDQLTGSYLATVDNDDGSSLQSVLSLAGGGVAIVHDIAPAGPPWTGSWEARGRGRFRATVWTGFPGDTGPGSPGPTLRLRLRGRVDDDEISGTFAFVVFAPDGTEAGTGSGTFAGSRIEA